MVVPRRGLTLALLTLATGPLGCVHSAPTSPRAIVGTSVGAPTVTPAREFDDTDPAALTLFRPDLAAYGAWIDDAVAGAVWVPSVEEVGEGFVPYASHGHFTYREGQSPESPEYVWVSDVSWGWVTFHYGRWTYLAPRGVWAWVPGRRYAGAWVTFRVEPGCAARGPCVVGWGPSAPHFAWRGEEAVRRPGQTSLFVYARATDLFDEELSERLLRGEPLRLASSRSVVAEGSPALAALGVARAPAPPVYDAELRRAALYGTPASASAMGVGPSLHRGTLRTFVAGSPRYVAGAR